jgi:hypothetical protein
VHQILFLLFGDLLLYKTRFLHPYKEQNSLHIGLLAKPFQQFRFQSPPPLLQVIINKHKGKDKTASDNPQPST